MAHKDRDSLHRFPQKGRASTQMSVSTLTDAALIAFEIEHERNRLRDELNRLQSAQNDAVRSLEILDFMASRMDSDPLVNPQNTDNILNNGVNGHTTPSNHVPFVHSGGSMMNGSNSASSSSAQIDSSNSEMLLNLEYLPANTLIRLANKQTKRVSELHIGDKVISLCINAYPQSAQKRDSFLPKPSKRPSQIALQQQQQQSTSPPSMQSRQSLQNGLSRTKSLHHAQRSLSGIPQRVRAKTHAIAAIPFMLPPPERPNEEDDEFSSSSTASMAQQYHSKKKDSFPRKSMPFMAYPSSSNSNSYEDENHFHDQHRYTSPNLIAQSVTAAVNESLISANNNTSNKPRSRSIATALTSYSNNGHGLGSPLQDHSSAELDEEEEDKSPSPPRSKQHAMHKARSSASFTQIPGPMPRHQTRSHHAAQARLQTRAHTQRSHQHPHPHKMHAPVHKARYPSQPVPMDVLRAAKSQNSSPNARNGYQQSQYLENNVVPLSRSQNNSPRFAGNGVNHHPMSRPHATPNPSNNRTKKTRFSTNDAMDKKDMFKQKMKEKIQRKKSNGNYLESVHVIQIIQTKIYKLVEIITENDFRIRCSPTHMFWICGKGWGCYDSKSRMSTEKKIAMRHSQNSHNDAHHENGRKVKLAEIRHELKKGEQLLTVGGHKYGIADIQLVEKPKGITAYSIIVNKNHCFFANDLLVKNAIS
eukprot:CAMPEP_0197026694 /NCGR_PEP_ID=MMETSP1384-20130603/6727_1 /TAXON_ID=29189 /ORGANISM="Ammonia sp." /LENGTH=699 /DNA_ID=CAMNT_0042455403 /DNA_START=11 /DNA_END=2110 /DNA_ORIENTATION=-